MPRRNTVERRSARILFVTANLNAGGAQRSLGHLLRGLQPDFASSSA
jgi:hypothetical protein